MMKEYHVVLAKRTIKDANGKRVRRSVPQYFAFSVWSMENVSTWGGFIGYTRDALRRGDAGRHYGRPVAVCETLTEADTVANKLNDMLAPLEWPGVWTPLQIGYSEAAHETTPEPAEARQPQGGYGNLVWASVRGMLTHPSRHNQTTRVLLDLESIHRTRFGDTYVGVVHKQDVDTYGNEGVYTTEIVSVDSPRAARLLGL